ANHATWQPFVNLLSLRLVSTKKRRQYAAALMPTPSRLSGIQLDTTGAYDLITALPGHRCLHLPFAQNRTQRLLCAIRPCALPTRAKPRRWQPEKGGSGFFRKPRTRAPAFGAGRGGVPRGADGLRLGKPGGWSRQSQPADLHPTPAPV